MGLLKTPGYVYKSKVECPKKYIFFTPVPKVCITIKREQQFQRVT